MEPCLNPALEAQAIGRVHRLGQKRQVKVVRLIVEDSIETRARVMLERKYGPTAIGKSLATKEGSEPSGDADAGDEKKEEISNGDKKPAPVSRAPPKTPEATAVQTGAGSLRTDKATMVVQDLDLLFGVKEEELEFHPNDNGEEDMDIDFDDSPDLPTSGFI